MDCDIVSVCWDAARLKSNVGLIRTLVHYSVVITRPFYQGCTVVGDLCDRYGARVTWIAGLRFGSVGTARRCPVGCESAECEGHTSKEHQAGGEACCKS